MQVSFREMEFDIDLNVVPTKFYCNLVELDLNIIPTFTCCDLFESDININSNDILAERHIDAHTRRLVESDIDPHTRGLVESDIDLNNIFLAEVYLNNNITQESNTNYIYGTPVMAIPQHDTGKFNLDPVWLKPGRFDIVKVKLKPDKNINPNSNMPKIHTLTKYQIIHSTIYCAIYNWGIEIIENNLNRIIFKVTDFYKYYNQSMLICPNTPDNIRYRVKSLTRWFVSLPSLNNLNKPFILVVKNDKVKIVAKIIKTGKFNKIF